MSSYRGHHYNRLIAGLIKVYDPRTIVEFGILDGFSLRAIIQTAHPRAKIKAYDIFDEFEGNHANKEYVTRCYPNVTKYGDFYEAYQEIADESIDMFHIDIANTGDTYRFFFEHYLPKLTPKGFAILEGGSEERDNYKWMVKYNKPKIQEALKECGYPYFTFEPFPSLTIVARQ